jgi:hypothetical protein
MLITELLAEREQNKLRNEDGVENGRLTMS